MNRNQNFYNQNSVRSYPLDDHATRTGDDGARLPNDVLVDANIRFPGHLGEYAYLSSATVTENLVTVTFLACPDPDSASPVFTPLAAATARRPVQSGRHYALDALYPGVGGWVVFGDTEEIFNGRFSTPRQGLLLSRCARPYFNLPVESVRKLGVASALTGLVTLKSGSDIEIAAEDRFVAGRTRKVIVVRLNSFSGGRNVFDIYKGPCGKRPESENCDKPGVEFLNSVAPDCNGNIQIVFSGDTEVTPYDGSSEGLILDHPLGLIDACTRDDRLPDRNGRLPNEYDDNCTSEFEGQESDVDDNTAGEDPPYYDVPDTSSEIVDCPDMPHTETFDDGEAEGFRVLYGQFGFVSGDSPAQPENPTPGMPYVYRFVRSGSSVSSSSLSSFFPEDTSYAAQAVNRRNVSIWDTCAHADTMDKRVRVDLAMMEGGPKTNAGIILNYHTVGTLSQHDEYMVAEVDQPSDSLRLRLWTGTTFLTLGSIPGLGLLAEDWYRIEVEVTPGADPLTQTRIKVTLNGITDPGITASFTATTLRYLPADGRFGLTSDQSLAKFSYFYLEAM